MSTLVGLQESRGVWEHPPISPLNEAIWEAWLLKGVALERNSLIALMRVATWASIAALLAAAGLWAYVTPYQVVLRFIFAAGAVVVMLQAFQARRYAFAAGFGALALLYNPLFPVFSFAGDWQRTFVAASAVPFAASLTWRSPKTAKNV